MLEFRGKYGIQMCDLEREMRMEKNICNDDVCFFVLIKFNNIKLIK